MWRPDSRVEFPDSIDTLLWLPESGSMPDGRCRVRGEAQKAEVSSHWRAEAVRERGYSCRAAFPKLPHRAGRQAFASSRTFFRSTPLLPRGIAIPDTEC